MSIFEQVSTHSFLSINFALWFLATGWQVTFLILQLHSEFHASFLQQAFLFSGEIITPKNYTFFITLFLPSAILVTDPAIFNWVGKIKKNALQRKSHQSSFISDRIYERTGNEVKPTVIFLLL